MKLDDYREEIDRIDEQIIELFGRRMEVACRIGPVFFRSCPYRNKYRRPQ